MTTDKKSDCSGSKRRRENDESPRIDSGTTTEQSLVLIIDDNNVSTMILQMMLELDGLSMEDITAEAASTGFRPEMLEKVIHLLRLLEGFSHHRTCATIVKTLHIEFTS